MPWRHLGKKVIEGHRAMKGGGVGHLGGLWVRLRHVGYDWQLISDLPCLQVQAQCRGLQHDVQAPRKAERRINIIITISKAGTLVALASRSNVSLVLRALHNYQCCAGMPVECGLCKPPEGECHVRIS